MEDKRCGNCKHAWIDDDAYPCRNCTNHDLWVEEQTCDNCVFKEVEAIDKPCCNCGAGEDSKWTTKQNCDNCRYAQLDGDEYPCCNCNCCGGVQGDACGWEEKLDDDFFAEEADDKNRDDANPINSPSHYTQGRIEVINFILDQKMDYCEGNVVKYVCRYKFKGTPLEDLMKARKYIEFLIEREYEREV